MAGAEMRVAGAGQVVHPRAERRRMRRDDFLLLWISRVILWLAALLSLVPTLWVIVASLQRGDAFFAATLQPGQWTLANYAKVLEETGFPTWMRNSLVVSTSTAFIQLVLTALAAYAFSRFRFWGRRWGLMALVLLQMFPASMTLVAIYTLLAKLNLLDNLAGLVLVFSGSSAWTIWLLTGYLNSIPKELDEAAKIDGASEGQILLRVILPLALPILAVVFLFSFIGTYSEFTISSLVVQSPENYTLAVGMQHFVYNAFAAHWTRFSAAALMASVPVVALWMLLQRYVVSGLAAGAVKG